MAIHVNDLFSSLPCIAQRANGMLRRLLRHEQPDEPKWRNGRRSGLKIRRPKGREGSSPSFGTWFASLTGRGLGGGARPLHPRFVVWGPGPKHTPPNQASAIRCAAVALARHHGPAIVTCDRDDLGRIDPTLDIVVGWHQPSRSRTPSSRRPHI